MPVDESVSRQARLNTLIDLSRTLDGVARRAQCSRWWVLNACEVLTTELGLPTLPQRPKEFVAAHASAPECRQRPSAALARWQSGQQRRG